MFESLLQHILSILKNEKDWSLHFLLTFYKLKLIYKMLFFYYKRNVTENTSNFFKLMVSPNITKRRGENVTLSRVFP